MKTRTHTYALEGSEVGEEQNLQEKRKKAPLHRLLIALFKTSSNAKQKTFDFNEEEK